MTKTLFSLFAVTLLSSYSIVTEAFAVKHIVNVQNYVFVPANLNVQVGDTIRWVWINGSHTTTSTTIPTGAAPWDAPMTSSNQVFEYRVGVAGVYNYLCTPHPNTQIGSFTATMPAATLSVTPTNRDVTSAAGSTTFNVTSNSNWTAVSNAGWCTVTSSGSGNGTIVANYQANTSTSQRIATITVTVAGLPSSVVTVTQAGAAATLAVTPSNRDVTSDAGNTTFSVTSNSNWTASSNSDWCTVTPSGSGNGTINASYQANTTSSTRVATITVSVAGLPNSTVTVTQAGFVATLSVTPSNRNVTADAGNTTFTVTSNSSWTAVSDAGWCTVTPSGSGNGTINASYQGNTSSSSRVATITVTVAGIPSSVVTVTQAGFVATLSVTPSNRNVSSEAGSTTFTVSSNSNWAAVSNSEWVAVTSSGSGNGIITAQYDANSGTDSRVALITVSASGVPSQTVTVTQAGNETVLLVDPLNQNVTYHSGTTSFVISSNTNWVVSSSDSWVSSTADGSGNGVIVVDYEENTSPDFRIATLIVSAGSENQLITITQEGTVSTINNQLTGISVYPNPSTGIINITSDNNGKPAQLWMYDLKGNVLLSNELNGFTSYKLNASNLAKGTYLLKLEQNSKTFVTRVVISE